jgi:hypothetical protein
MTSCTSFPTGTPKYVDSNSPFVGSDSNLAYRWVRVTLKANNTAGSPYYVSTSGSSNSTRICWDGTQETPATAATCEASPVVSGTYLGSSMQTVYVLTSLAVVPNSNSRRMVQMEVANDPPFVTNAALDTDDFVTVKGTSVTVNGYDNCQCSCTNPPGGSGDPVCTNRTTGTACSGNTYSIYSSQTVDTSGNPSLVAGTTPAVAENQDFPYNIDVMIAKYSSQTGAVSITGSPYNLTCSSGTPYNNCGQLTTGSLGTPPTGFPSFDPTNPTGMVNQITYVPGSLDLKAHTDGAGVLIVNGDLTIDGGLNFYGLIIVKGVLTFSGSGSGQATNVIGSILAGNGSVADKLSGGVNVQFDKCALLNNQTPSPPSLLSAHELPY